MPRIKKRELEGLIDAVESPNVVALPQPEKVWISDSRIWIQPRRLKVVRPLESNDLFMSFAKLAAYGEPSEARIGRWVARFGLPIKEAPKRYRDPRSMEVKEFREEAGYAHDLLDVYLKIRDEDAAGIMAKVKGPVSRLDREFSDAFKENQRRWLLHPGPRTDRGLPDGMTFRDFRDLLIIVAARLAVGDIVTKLVSDIRLRVGVEDTQGFASSWQCDDLLSALYLQFYQLITKSRPLRYCENCGQPFELTRSNRRFCTDTCRSGGRAQHRQS